MGKGKFLNDPKRNISPANERREASHYAECMHSPRNNTRFYIDSSLKLKEYWTPGDNDYPFFDFSNPNF